jgi:hypothetical protein
MVLSFMLDHREEHPRIGQAVGGNGRWFHFTRLTAPEDVDGTLRAY